MTNSDVDIHFNNDFGTAFAERARLNQQKLIFDARFWRWYRTLHFISRRVLRHERAEEAAISGRSLQPEKKLIRAL
jgi:hypothetical protein